MFDRLWERLLLMSAGILGLYLFWLGFLGIGERHAKLLMEEHFDFFEGKHFSVQSLDYFRGDYLARIQHGDLKWTFNRYTGELIPWGSKEWKLQNKKERLN